jgi:hypothetical protein
MTAINFVRRRDGLHFITDGASYLLDGTLVAIGSKVHVLEHLPAVIAIRGPTIAGPILSGVFRERYATFDALVDDVEELLPDLYERSLHLFADAQTELEVYIGGWSEARRRYEVYSINTYDQSERLAEYADEIGIETKFAPPFKLLHVDTEVFIAPCLPEGAIERGFGEKPFSSVDAIPIDAFARTILELQRERKLALFPDMPAAHYVGGFAEVTTVTRDRVESRVIHRWDDDVVGELIEPEPIDWAEVAGRAFGTVRATGRIESGEARNMGA